MSTLDTSHFDLNNLPNGFYEDPFKYYSSLRQTEPVKFLPDNSVLISSWQDLNTIYRDTQNFKSDKKISFGEKFGNTPLFEHHTTSLVFNDPPLHSRVRKIMTGAMNPKAVALMEPGLEILVKNLLGEMNEEANLIEEFAMRIPVEVIGNLFNIPHSLRNPLRDWSLSILGALEPTPTKQELEKGNNAVLEFKEFLKKITDERRRNPGDPDTDVLTRMIIAEESNLSETELLQNCIFILNAGHETTTNLIGNALWALSIYPIARKTLIENPAILNSAIDEFLRFLSPNQFGNRETAFEVSLSGKKNPKKYKFTPLYRCGKQGSIAI
jgi:cytochrome P450